MTQANTATTRSERTPGPGRDSRYVGRVGALAVALGVGVAVATTPGLAWAGPEPDTTNNPGTPEPKAVISGSATPEPDPTGTTRPPAPDTPAVSGATANVGEDASPKTSIGASGGANTAVNGQPTEGAEGDQDTIDTIDADADSESLEPAQVIGTPPAPKNDNTPRNTITRPADPITTVAAAVVNLTQAVISLAIPSPATATATPPPAPAAFARTAAVTETVTTAIEPNTTTAPGIVGAVTRVVASVLAPFFTPGPETPPAPTLLWAVLAWVRREIDTTVTKLVTPPTNATLTSQAVAPMALARAAAPTTLAAAAAPPPPPPTGVLPAVTFVVAGVGNVVGGILGFLGSVIGGVFNAPPTARPTIDYVDDYSGSVFGQLNATDPNGDALSYAITTPPTNGAATVDDTGYFFYTPKPAARLQAAATPGPDVDKFTVTVTDARGAKTTVVVNNVPIVPNRAPLAGTPTVGNPDPVTGAVIGTLNASDPDGDSLSYAASGRPAKGSVDFEANGSFTYRPTEQARQAAANGGAATTDSFTVVVSDGRGGSLTQTVAVRVAPYPAQGSSNAISFADGVFGEAVNRNTGDLYVTTYRFNRDPAQESTTVTLIRADGSRRIVGTVSGQRPYDRPLVDSTTGTVYQLTGAYDPVTGTTLYVTAFRSNGTTFTAPTRGGLPFLNSSSGTVHAIANSDNALDTHVVTTIRPDGTVITSPSLRGTGYAAVTNAITGSTYYTAGTRDGQTTVNAIAPDGTVTVKTVPGSLLTFSPTVDPLNGAVYQPVLAGSDPASRQATLVTILPNGSVRETVLPPGLITTGPRVNPATGTRVLPASKFESETNQYSATVLFSMASDGSLTPLASLLGKEVGTVFRPSGGEYVFTYHPTTNITRVFAVAPDGATSLITQVDGQPSFNTGLVNPVTRDVYVQTDRYDPSTQTRVRVLTVVHPNGTSMAVPLYGGSDQGYYSPNLLTVNPVNGNAYEVTTTVGALSYVTVVKPDGSVAKFTAPSNLTAEGVVVDPISGIAYLGGNRQVILVDRTAV